MIIDVIKDPMEGHVGVRNHNGGDEGVLKGVLFYEMSDVSYK